MNAIEVEPHTDWGCHRHGVPGAGAGAGLVCIGSRDERHRSGPHVDGGNHRRGVPAAGADARVARDARVGVHRFWI